MEAKTWQRNRQRCTKDKKTAQMDGKFEKYVGQNHPVFFLLPQGMTPDVEIEVSI